MNAVEREEALRATHEARRRFVRRGRLARLGRRLGPGIVSGAADNDPTTVATLIVVGATTVYGLAWLVVLVIPMLAVIQTISAAVATVGRAGLEDLICQRYGRWWGYGTLVAILAINLVTLGADLEAGCAALGLITHLPDRWFVVPFAIVVAVLLLFGTYLTVENVLKFATLIFLAYVASALLAHPDWHAVLRATVVPHPDLSPQIVAGALALLGTTLTSYAYVWETIGVAERRPPLRHLGLVQIDATLGTIVAGITFYFILVTSGATLGLHHHTNVATAQAAATALAPLAGEHAALLFGLGLLSSALLAVPVLAGTCAYVMAEAFGWRRSLDASFVGAPRFYTALLVSVVIGAAIALAGVGPITLLFWSSLAGGFGTPLTLVFLLLIARDRTLMGDHRITPGLALAGWVITLIVVATCGIYLGQTVSSVLRG